MLRQSGHTLFELLIVLAVITYAAMLAVPAIGASKSAIEAKALAAAIDGELKLARSRAILSSRSTAVLIDLANRRWRAEQSPEWTPIGKGLSLNITALSQTAGDSPAILYYPDGGSSGGDIRIASKSRVYTVKAALNGKTTIERETG